MSNYGWVITRDTVSEAGDCGVHGPRDTKFKPVDIIGKGERFRMKDDDGNVCYEGYCVHEGDEEGVFGPLTDFGMPNAGCTIIEYLEGGRWEAM